LAGRGEEDAQKNEGHGSFPKPQNWERPKVGENPKCHIETKNGTKGYKKEKKRNWGIRKRKCQKQGKDIILLLFNTQKGANGEGGCKGGGERGKKKNQ